jgi:PTH1 family peptidyl-tRNA hydrolase
MKLMVGLGNPGNEYAKNRHNVGFMFVEFFTKKIDASASFNIHNKFNANIAELNHEGEKYLVAEPQTYMNRSGETVSRLAAFYKIKPEDIIVAHDDLDILLGKSKIQMANGPKLHNGLASIEQLFGTANFWRIRIGVESRTGEYRPSGEEFVLQDFTREEKLLLQESFEKIYHQLFLQKVL